MKDNEMMFERQAEYLDFEEEDMAASDVAAEDESDSKKKDKK